jgi:hypothetical protein
MSIKGEQALGAVQELIDQEQRAEASELALELAKAAQPQMTELSLSDRSLKLFESFRAASIKSANSADILAYHYLRNNAPAAEVNQDPKFIHFFLRLTQGAEIDQKAVKRLYDGMMPLYSELEGKLLQSRSRRSHTEAVLRIFKPRYLSGWRTDNVTQIDFADLERETKKLRERRLSSTEEIQTWSQDVFDLFAKTAVMTKEQRDFVIGRSKIDPKAKRPLGLISEGSLDIYSSRWKTWFALHSPELLQLDYSSIPPLDSKISKSEAARHIWDEASKMREDLNWKMKKVNDQILSLRSTLASNLKGAIRVKLESASDVGLNSSWSSPINPETIQGLSSWIAETRTFWGAAAETVKGELIFGSGSNESKHSLPEMSLDNFSKLVSDAISRRIEDK